MKLNELRSLIQKEIKSVLSEASFASKAELAVVKAIMEDFDQKKIISISTTSNPSNQGFGNDMVKVYVTPNSRFYKAGKKPKTIEQKDTMPEVTVYYEDYKKSGADQAPLTTLAGLWSAVHGLSPLGVLDAKPDGFIIGDYMLAVDDVKKDPKQIKALEGSTIYYKGGPSKSWWLRTWR